MIVSEILNVMDNGHWSRQNLGTLAREVGEGRRAGIVLWERRKGCMGSKIEEDIHKN